MPGSFIQDKQDGKGLLHYPAVLNYDGTLRLAPTLYWNIGSVFNGQAANSTVNSPFYDIGPAWDQYTVGSAVFDNFTGTGNSWTLIFNDISSTTGALFGSSSTTNNSNTSAIALTTWNAYQFRPQARYFRLSVTSAVGNAFVTPSARITLYR